MTSRSKVIAFFSLMAVVDTVVPLPVLAVVGAYVAITRPPWFVDLVGRVYQGAPPPLPDPDEEEEDTENPGS